MAGVVDRAVGEARDLGSDSDPNQLCDLWQLPHIPQAFLIYKRRKLY